MSKTVNLGAKYDHRVTLRLNEEQYQFLITLAGLLDVSPSDYLRMSLNAQMIGTRDELEKVKQKGIEVGMNENVKAYSDNIV